MEKPVSLAPPFRLAATAACATALSYVVFLVNFLRQGKWIVGADGHPIVTDFLPVYAAGLLARSGHAATAYDWLRFHDVQVGLVGHSFAGYLGWHYPPLHFLTAMVLSWVSYPAAFLIWVCATSALFAVVMARIARQPMAAAMVLALPPALACALVGQNGFFSAALFGALLLWLPRRPLLAGVVLAALAFKPQLGVLIPFALIAGGYFRTLAVAVLLSALWIGIGLLMAPESFVAFLHYLPATSQAVLTGGTTGWDKLQSVYALMRLLGFGDAIGWSAQILALLLGGALNVWLWRQRGIPFELKAAALVCAALLSTPYLYFYDLPLIALPLAFLVRGGTFTGIERVAVAGVVLALIAGLLWNAPFGLLAIVLSVALVLRRTLARTEIGLSAPSAVAA